VATVLGLNHQIGADRLLAASAAWFGLHGVNALPAAEVLRRGWIISLPRMRQLVSASLAK
jgi:hypothetical protein